jgi:hypothetical protein
VCLGKDDALQAPFDVYGWLFHWLLLLYIQ